MFSIKEINDFEKTIDSKNRTIVALKNIVKKWVHEYNMLDACNELQGIKIKSLLAEKKLLKDTIKNKNLVGIVEENERLKREFEIESLTDNTTGETIYRSNLINNLQEENERLNKLTGIFSARLCEKYRTTLQEIKKIAEYIIASDTEKWTLDEPFKQMEEILQKITKAEEE